MRYFASIGTDLICNGIQSSTSEVIGDHTIEITAQVESGMKLDDFRWRKFENGSWSTDKFEPIDTSNNVTVDDRLSALESALLEMMLS